jgi:hypothetical protein
MTHNTKFQVPPNMTHLLQPLDVSVNGHVKSLLRDKFERWYADAIVGQVSAGTNLQHITVDCNLSAIKEVHAAWIISIYHELKEAKEIITGGFRRAGIIEALDENFSAADNPFSDLLV